MRNKIITSFFCLLLAVSTLAGLLLPDRYYSEREKRTLTQKPKFTVADFISGKFSDNLESYLTDQVPLRDGWVTMKTYMELTVGKRESGGVYICKDKYLMDKFTSYSKKQLASNAATLVDLQEKLAAEGISMNMILVPMAAQVLTDKLPAHAPVADYTAILQVLTDAGVDTTDVFLLSPLIAARTSTTVPITIGRALGPTMPIVRGAVLSLRRANGRRKYSAIISTARLGIKSRCPPFPLRKSPHGIRIRPAMFPTTMASMKQKVFTSASTYPAATSTLCF